MKNIINSLFFVVLAACVFQGCKDDVEYQSYSGAVSSLVLPEDNTHIDLMKAPHTMIRFQWDAPDATNAYLYKIAFYTAPTGGTPFYSVESDDAGATNTFTISQKELGRIAGIAGIDQQDTGDVYWNVIATNGSVENQPKAARYKITVGRYAGIEDVPVSIYLYGEAGEGGTTYDAMPKFKFIDDGVFEIFTYLEGGKDFNITNRRVAADSRNFWIDDEGNLWEGSKTDMGAAPANDGVYRITLDFLNATAKFEEITLMQYWYCSDQGRNRVMDYIGYGKWKTDEFQINFGDNRYAFDSNIGGRRVRWGYIYDDSKIVPDVLSGSYFNVFDYYSWKDAWEYSFKFNSEINGNYGTLYLDLSSDQDYYSHTIDVRSTTPDPVLVLNAPADGELADIRVMGAGGTLTFDWDAVDGPSSLPERYELVFFSDEECNNQIILQEDGGMNDEIRYIPGNGGLDTDYTLTSSELQALGDMLEANDAGDKVIYWTVRSRIMGYRTLGAVRKLVIRPLALPTSVAVTGNSSEFGSGRYEFRMMGAASAGLFEAYCKFNGGNDYKLIDNFNREWVISGNTIDIGSGGNPNLDGIYRINLDFFAETVKIEKITDVVFHIPVTGTNVTLDYKGAGLWSANEAMTNWNAGWDDDRCYCWVTTDGTRVKYGWPHVKPEFNNGASYGEYLPEGEDDKYYVYPVTDTSQWDCSWKVHSTYRGRNNVRLNIKLNMGTAPDYYYIFFEYPDGNV